MVDLSCITCEPNFLIPETVTIAKIKEEEKKLSTKNEVDAQFVEVTALKKELVATFSLNRNDYLRCKWNQFLENVPKDVLMIKPYKEFKKRKYPVRRMMLNGAFYKDSKMIPVPHMSGQRK